MPYRKKRKYAAKKRSYAKRRYRTKRAYNRYAKSAKVLSGVTYTPPRGIFRFNYRNDTTIAAYDNGHTPVVWRTFRANHPYVPDNDNPLLSLESNGWSARANDYQHWKVLSSKIKIVHKPIPTINTDTAGSILPNAQTFKIGVVYSDQLDSGASMLDLEERRMLRWTYSNGTKHSKPLICTYNENTQGGNYPFTLGYTASPSNVNYFRIAAEHEHNTGIGAVTLNVTVQIEYVVEFRGRNTNSGHGM